MVYRNNPESEKLFFKKWLLRIVLIYSFALVWLVVLMFATMWLDESFREAWWIFAISFCVTVCMMVLIPLVLWKKIKKNYHSYSFEITDDEILATENGVQKKIKIPEITKIVRVKEKKYKICTKFSVVYTSDFAENLDELLSRLAQIKTPEPEKYSKFVTAFVWIFLAGFFIVSRIPNLPLPLYIFFGTGFIVAAVVGMNDLLRRSDVKLWVKIYLTLLYGFFIAVILWNFFRIARHYLFR